jgi:hypothetical protein
LCERQRDIEREGEKNMGVVIHNRCLKKILSEFKDQGVESHE